MKYQSSTLQLRQFLRWISSIVFCVILMLLPVQAQDLSKEDFLLILEAAEKEIVSISADIKVFKMTEPSFSNEIPIAEGRFIYSPWEEKQKAQGFHRLAKKYSDLNGIEMDPNGFPVMPFHVVCEGKRMTSFYPARNVGSVIPAEKGMPVGGIFLPRDLLGWGLVNDRVRHVPLSKKIREDERVSIESVSWDPEEGPNLLLVEIVEVIIDEQGRGLPSIKFDIWFDMNRSVRPVRIDEYDDGFGYVQYRHDNIVLKELRPGIWFPTSGTFRAFKHPELDYDRNADPEFVLQSTRKERWDFFKKIYPTNNIRAILRLEAKVSLNQSHPVDTFRLVFPPKSVYWDGYLKASIDVN